MDCAGYRLESPGHELPDDRGTVWTGTTNTNGRKGNWSTLSVVSWFAYADAHKEERDGLSSAIL